jgi:NAD(P)-dependent dehydrogenase (short-subunit alcohol dehydrogenase family)
MGRTDGKAAVITNATFGMALATARIFVGEGPTSSTRGRLREELDEAVRSIGRDVTRRAGPDNASIRPVSEPAA